MFGKPLAAPQDEVSYFAPRSIYGAAKLMAYWVAENYKTQKDIFVATGILYNHESPLRSPEFVTRKITSNVAKIATGKIDRFSLGDLSPRRDWGYAGDYVNAMWLMLQQEKGDDYIIATGKTFSVQDFLVRALETAGLKGPIDKYVDFDPTMVRPSEVDLLVGDASKAQRNLGWSPEIQFDALVDLMVRNDLRIESLK
jgi:GDPmannose 4,6-dehydratase